MTITAGIHVYNGAAHLPETLASIRQQTRPVDDVLVVDDGSTDGSGDIAEALGARVIRHATNRGVAAASNTGVAEAQTSHVAWIDSDDLWDADHIEALCALCALDPTADFAFSAMRLMPGPGVWMSPQASVTPDRLWAVFFQTFAVPMSANMVRTDAMRAAGGFREIPVSPDFEFWLRMTLRYRGVWTQRRTATYRRHAASISATQGEQQWINQWRGRRLVLADLEDEGDPRTDEMIGAYRERYGRELAWYEARNAASRVALLKEWALN